MRHLILALFLTIGCVVGKECTNVFPYASHTFRNALLTSKNETWKKEIMSRFNHSFTANNYASLASLLPRRMMRQEDQTSLTTLHRQKANHKRSNKSGKFLKEVPLNDVRLLPDSMYATAQQTNLEYLLMLDVDNLAWSFRKTAGFPTPGQPYGGWEDKDGELRGHFVGHFMSASAKMWASTKNDTLKQRMSAIVNILSQCQSRDGYLSAFPSSFFDRVEALNPVWAPYYTIHKVMAGLLDQYTFGGNAKALEMLKRMADYHYNRVKNVIQKYSIERQWLCLNEETGGMNDVLYNLYSVTGNPKYLWLAHLFDKPCFLGQLALKDDSLSNFHTNTHIPIVTGTQMRYEITGDPLYREISTFFVDAINSSHTYATGGTSADEHWSDPKRLATTLGTENEESCTTYNMLKVARNLFRWTKAVKYADYYERALINGVLSIQRGREPGVMIYMLPQKPGASKAVSYHGWGNPFNTFWCCYGTATESFSKLGDSIYFEEEGEVPGLYIIQYIPSSFHWRTGGIQLHLKSNPVAAWDNRFRVTVTITAMKAATVKSTLHFRIPIWTNTDAAKALLNNQALDLPAPGNFLSVTRRWSRGDRITLEFPISLRLEAISDDRPEYSSVHAILYGPYLLAGLSGGDCDIKVGPGASLADWISPIQEDYSDHLISLSQMAFSLASSSSGSLIFMASPEPGTNEAVNATFRLILQGSSVKISSPRDAIGKLVTLELYGRPGMVVAHQGADKTLHAVSSFSSDDSSVFHMVAGLDGDDGTVSLESANQKGCYIYSYQNTSDVSTVNLGCFSRSNASLSRAASFKVDKGISEYHPISFVAKGANRTFLLVPLLSLRDETYTVYFNI